MASQTSTTKEKRSKYFQEYSDAKAFKTSLRLFDLYRIWDNFKMSYQWGESKSKKAKPVNNVIGRIIRYKVPAVVSNNIEFQFDPQEEIVKEGNERLFEVSEVFSRYANTAYEQMEMKQKNEKMGEVASTVGAGYIHFVWDNNVIRGNSNPYLGILTAENINPINYYPKNPMQSDVQLQPSFIIKSRMDTDKVKAIAEQVGVSKQDIELIVPNTLEANMHYSGADTQQTNANQTDVYWRYEKRMEEMDLSEEEAERFGTAKPMHTKVYWSLFTESVDIVDNMELKGHTLYPMDGMVWHEREDFAFGQGEVEPIIPNQKAINLIQGMQIEVIKKLGMPPIIVNETKFKGDMSFDSGKVYRTKGATDNTVQVLNPGQFNPQMFDLFNVMVQSTKEFAAATEDALGERTGSDLNATAIALQQKAAKTPLKPLQSHFSRAQRRFGLIMSEFWVNNYTDRTLTYTNKDGEQEEFEFNADEFRGFRFDLSVQVTSSADFSDELDVSTLNQLKADGDITKEQYVRFLPKEYASFKDRLLDEWQVEENQQTEEEFAIILEQLNEMAQAGRIQDFFSQPFEQQLGLVNEIRESIQEVE